MPTANGTWLSGEKYVATLCVGCKQPFQCPVEQRRILCRACEKKDDRPATRKVLIECDSCPELIEGENGVEFSEIWAEAKREGWTARKIANEWLHGCPKCGVPT